MKKTIKTIMLSLLAALTILSCKRSTDFEDIKNSQRNSSGFTRKTGSGPTLDCDEMAQHLKWIARGLAHWPKNSTLVRQIDSITTISNNDSNENPILYLNTQFSFGGKLEDSVDATFAVNDYDETGLEGFTMGSTQWYTKIFIPNTNYSLDKPFVVVPEDCINDSNTIDTMKGYYLNSLGNIDSLWLNDENLDSFYIWVIDYYNLSEWDDWESDGADGFQRKSGRVMHCNNNSICEGPEKFNPNCTDCYNILTPAPQKYRVVITELKVFQDASPYKERMLGGKYDFAVSYGLQDGTGTSSNTGSIIDWYHDMLVKRVPRKDVCRKTVFNKQRGGNCPSGTHAVDIVLYEEIIPSNTTLPCVMNIVFFERDNEFALNPSTYVVTNYQLGNPYYSSAYGSIPHLPWYSWQSEYIKAQVNLHNMWVSNPNGSSFVVGNNEAEIKIELQKIP